MQDTDETQTVAQLRQDVSSLKTALEGLSGLVQGLEKGLEALILSHPQLEIFAEAFAHAARPPSDGSEDHVADGQALYKGLETMQSAVQRARLWQEERQP